MTRVRMVAGMLLLGVADLVETAAFHVLPLPTRSPVPTDVDEDGWVRNGDGTIQADGSNLTGRSFTVEPRWPSE